LVLFDPLAGSFWVLHRFLFLADDLDLDVEDDLHPLVGFDLFVGDLPKVHESLDRFPDDFLHAVAFQCFYLSHVAELRHPHVNLEEHHLEDLEGVAFVQQGSLLFHFGLAVEVLENEVHHLAVLFDRFPLDLSPDVLHHQEGQEDLLKEFLHMQFGAPGPHRSQRD